MKRAQSVVAVVMSAAIGATVVMAPVLAAAQAPLAEAPRSQSLVDVAKAEEARRKGVRKPTKVYTNGDLKADNSASVPATPATPATAAAPAPGSATPAIDIPAGTVPPATGETRDQAYWSGRISAARASYDRASMFAEALQSRINALTTDFVNRDDPYQRAKIEADRKAALAELDRVKKDMEGLQKQVTAIEDEARRAGVPSGWLRPGA